MSLVELMKLLPIPGRPAFPPTEEQWVSAEQTLGTSLPGEYKAFLRTYGSGRISDFLNVFSPGSPHAYDNLISVWRTQGPIFDEIQGGSAPLGIALHPARPGLLPIGQTDNGDMLFYVVDGSADAWKTAVLESRDVDVIVFDSGLASFLVSLLRHELDVLPDDLDCNFVASSSSER